MDHSKEAARRERRRARRLRQPAKVKEHYGRNPAERFFYQWNKLRNMRLS